MKQDNVTGMDVYLSLLLSFVLTAVGALAKATRTEASPVDAEVVAECGTHGHLSDTANSGLLALSISVAQSYEIIKRSYCLQS